MKELNSKKAFPNKNTSSHIEWQAPEFTYYPKDKSWFAFSAFIALGLTIWAILTHNFLFVLLIILGYFSIIVYALKKPRLLRIALTPKGIKIGKMIYSFENLKSFCIFYRPPLIKELSLRSKKTFLPYIKIPLGEANINEVRKFLSKYLPEKKHRRSLIDDLARSLKF